MRCQQFGHTCTYCTLPPVCVKCGQEHDNRSCTKAPETAPTCGLCGGNHTANYRGCPAYLKVKAPTRNQSNHTITVTNNTEANRRQPPAQYVPHSSQNKTSYAQVANLQSNDTTPSSTARIEQLFEKISGQIEMMVNQNMRIFDLLTKLVTKLI